MKETLIYIDDWSVCRHTDDSQDIEIYAEHVIGCNEETFSSSVSWGWEYDDGTWDMGYEACWKCYTRVPKEVVGLVLLYNWNKIGIERK